MKRLFHCILVLLSLSFFQTTVAVGNVDKNDQKDKKQTASEKNKNKSEEKSQPKEDLKEKQKEAAEKEEKTTSETYPIQLSPKDRIPKAEKKFIEQIKTAIKNKDEEAIRALFYLKNVNPAYKGFVPFVIRNLLGTDLSKSTFEIEPNNRAAQFNTRFTIPYLGTLNIKTTSEHGSSQMGIPIGIKNGKYYITIGAAG